MARQLLPIRFLSTAALFRASHSSSFSRFVAQLKLSDFPCSSRPCRLVHRREYTSGRTFSSRPARSGDSERGKIQMGSVSGQRKSLIEDEAELSDWVSDIRKDSFHKKVSSEDESSARGRGSGSRDRDGDSLRSRGGERSFRPAVRGGPSSGRIRGGGLGGYSSRGRRGVGSDESGDEHGDDFSRRMSNGRGNRPGDSYESRRGSGTNARGASAFSKRGGGDYGRVGRGRGGSSDYGNGGRFGQSRREEGEYAVGGRFGQSKRGRGDYQSSDRLGQSKRVAPVVSKNDDDDDDDDDDVDDDDFLSEEDKRPGNRPGSTSYSRKRLGGAGRGISSLSKRGERDNGIGERMGQDRRIGGDYNIGGRIGQSRRGVGDYEAGGRLGQGKRLGRDSQVGERPSPSKMTALLASNKDDYDDDSDDDDDVNDDEDDEEEDSDGPSGFGSDFFGDKEALKDRVAEGAIEKGSSVVSTDGDVLKAIPQTSTPRSESYLSQTRFDQFALSPLSLKGVKAAGYERMTEVQEATLPVILKGKDVLAKARTGTGKTVAFLLPAIEVVVKLPPLDRDNKRPPIHVLVICPTRELADQAAAEASKLLKYHASIGVQVVIGGTRLALEQKRMQTNPCQLLVATPGRLRDHMENTPGFVSRLSGVKVLVLDEADRLLDMGFRKDIEKIIAELPKQRQTLLFSATVPDQVRQMCYIAMKRDSEFISTVIEGSEETHSQVSQTHLIAPLEKQFSLLYRILTDHIAEDVDYKVILFCTTAMVTKLVADLLAELHLNVREMHSRKPQSYRTRVAKEFKESKGLILVTSDVSARGVDYPDVTLVIQVGVPADREQYIHRLGRTGRKGKEGKGILLLAPWEDFFLQSIRDLPITNAEVPIVDLDTRKKVERALAHVEMKNKESAYQAWLGYYKSIANIGREKSKLVLLANEFSRSMGLDNPPAIAMLTLRKMGLNNVPGLRSK